LKENRMKILRRLGATAILMAASAAWPVLAQQTDLHAGHTSAPPASAYPTEDHSGHTAMVPERPVPADPYAGHIVAPADAPADPHAHHHHGSAPMSSPLEATEARFDAQPVASIPQNGAALVASPPIISLTFAKATLLHQIVLTNAAGQRVPVVTALPAEPVGSFSSLLVRLDPGTYKLRWRGSDDAGETGGSIAFALR
jgi:methionine-rich copper-binding protein CopC